jgi:uncharacterized SAM-binding protein YcdF (DUF218 family)
MLIVGQARSTAQNFQYACALSGLKSASRIAIVTGRYHSYRAWATAERECPDIKFCSAAAKAPVPIRRRLSETGKLLAYRLLGYAALW